MREAPRLVLAARLLAEGAEVARLGPGRATRATLLRGVDALRRRVLEAVTGADAAVIVTEWPELRDLASPRRARRDAQRR